MTNTINTIDNAFANVSIERSAKNSIDAMLSGYSNKMGYALARRDGFDRAAGMEAYRVIAVFETVEPATAALNEAGEEEHKLGLFMKSQFVRAEINSSGNPIVVYEHDGFFGYRGQIEALRLYDKTSHEILDDIEADLDGAGWFAHPALVLAQIEAVREALIKSAALTMNSNGFDDAVSFAEVVFDKIESRFVVRAADGLAEVAPGLIRSAMKHTHTPAAWNIDTPHRYARITDEVEDRINHERQIEHRLSEAGI